MSKTAATTRPAGGPLITAQRGQMHHHQRRAMAAAVGLATGVALTLTTGCSSERRADDTTTTVAATATEETTTSTEAPETTTTTEAPETTTTLPAPVETTSVAIHDHTYDPPAISVKVGETITWTNGDDFAHTATSDDPGWDSGPLDPAATFSFTATAVGTFAYHCDIHNFMTGTVVVR